METTPTNTAIKEFQVTGVSRSGRVRKKSSKLLDFQSPDEVEKKIKRTSKAVRNFNRVRQASPSQGKVRRVLDVSANQLDPTNLEGAANHEGFDGPELRNIGLPTGDSDEDLKELMAGIVDGEEGSNFCESKVRQSLYMTEKSNKRMMLKDGKVVTKKLERKDKGKSRYTAYSMWARELRKTSKFSKNQDLDFSNTARRLGELWANVSNKEKNTWRRKAKIQATKARVRDKAAAAGSNTTSGSSVASIKATNQTRKHISDSHKVPLHTKVMKSNLNTPAEQLTITESITRRKKLNNVKSGNVAVCRGSYTSAATNDGVISFNPSSGAKPDVTSKFGAINKKFTLSNIEPIDAAAHLKLLGESLTIIGERLKEHEGQIAVSGSLSVLLDSLICSLGPLLCLTMHIPSIDIRPQLSENLISILDNIAYVMPGL